jgi:hypothetical protein
VLLVGTSSSPRKVLSSGSTWGVIYSKYLISGPASQIRGSRRYYPQRGFISFGVIVRFEVRRFLGRDGTYHRGGSIQHFLVLIQGNHSLLSHWRGFISGLASQIRGSLSRHIACRGGTIH